jgi:4-hydroxy 2-oxovalerate aldolase
MNAPRLTDTTLRDGSHPMRHRFTPEQVARVAGALNAAGVPVIEVAHGDGLAGSSLQYGFSAHDELALISAARDAAPDVDLAVLLIPGIGTERELRAAAERGADVVRIATHSTEADISQQHFAIARELGLEPIGFLMMAHMQEPDALAEQAALMAGYGAACVYVVDSAGAMLPAGVQARVRALRGALGAGVDVGFHGHDNMGLAIGNTLAAVEAGAARVDGCLRGLGAGAGNAPTEVLAAVLERAGHAAGVDVFALMDAAEHVVAPMMPFQPMADRASLTIGYAGVYSTFLLHANRLAERFGLDARDILVELGRRKAVAGQEDWVLDVAVELAGQAAGAASDDTTGVGV